MPTEFVYCKKCEKPFISDDIITTFKHGRLCTPCWHLSLETTPSKNESIEQEKNGL